MCCQVERCCFCLHHVLGVKILAGALIAVEVALIVHSALLFPQFMFAVGPTSCIGIFCDIFLLVAVFRSSRWLMLPWLIYIMILIVGLGLAAVLLVVIPLVSGPDWVVVLLRSAGCLAVAALLLYFWIVVLELFIKLGPPPPPPFYLYPQMAAGYPAAAVPPMQPGHLVSLQPQSLGIYQQPPPPIPYQPPPPIPPHQTPMLK